MVNLISAREDIFWSLKTIIRQLYHQIDASMGVGQHKQILVCWAGIEDFEMENTDLPLLKRLPRVNTGAIW